MDEEIKKISSRIKGMRKARNITQKQLAEALDISVTNMCNIENGKTAVTMQNLIKLKGAFGCELKDFFVDDTTQERAGESRAELVGKLTDAKQEKAQQDNGNLPESIDLQDAINLLRLLRRIDIKGI